MINLPYIPYIIFALIIVFGIYLGYKRGWRISIYAAILSIIAFCISYGLFTIFYETIADLISDVLYDEIGDPSYSWDDILVIGRPIIFTIAISIMYIPVILILWPITYPIYRYFNKKNYPTELQKISENERIISKPNNKVNKMAGIFVGALNTTITASIVTSAVAAVFINSSTFSSLFSITDSIASIISGGNLGNPIAYQYLVDFLPYTRDSELMESLSVLIRPNKDSLITQGQIDKLNEEDHKEALKNVLSIPESTKALLDTIDQKGNDWTWNPLEHLDDPSYSPVSSALDSLLTDNLKLELSIDEANNLVDWILSETIQDFEDTRYYKEWDDAKNARIDAEEELSRRISVRDQYISDIKTNVTEYNRLISTLDNHIVEHNSKLGQIPGMIIDRDNKENIEITERSLRDSLKTISDDKELIKNLEYSTYLSEKNQYDTYVRNRDDNESFYKRMDSEIAGHNSTIAKLESELISLERDLQSSESELTTLISDRNNKLSISNTAQAEYNSATIVYNSAYSNYLSAESELSSATTAWENAGKPTGDNATYIRYQNAISDERDKKNILSTAQKERDDKESEYDKAKDNYNSAVVSVQSKENEISKLESDIRANENLITSNEGSITSKTSARAIYYSEFIRNRDNAISQKPIMDAAEDDYNLATSEYNVAKANYDRQYSIWDNANDAYNSASSLLITTQNRVDELDVSLIPSTESSINTMYDRIDDMYQELSNIEFKQTNISDIDSRFTSRVSTSGGNGSNWSVAKPSITKTTYTEDASTESESIPFQESLIITLLEDESILLDIRNLKNIEFDKNVDEYKDVLKKVLVQK